MTKSLNKTSERVLNVISAQAGSTAKTKSAAGIQNSEIKTTGLLLRAGGGASAVGEVILMDGNEVPWECVAWTAHS